jgi:hypothetical protein
MSGSKVGKTKEPDDAKAQPKPADLDAMIAEALSRKLKLLIIPSPAVLGASVEEITANLDKIADAELPMTIVPKRHRVAGQ